MNQGSALDRVHCENLHCKLFSAPQSGNTKALRNAAFSSIECAWIVVKFLYDGGILLWDPDPLCALRQSSIALTTTVSLEIRLAMLLNLGIKHRACIDVMVV